MIGRREVIWEWTYRVIRDVAAPEIEQPGDFIQLTNHHSRTAHLDQLLPHPGKLRAEGFTGIPVLEVEHLVGGASRANILIVRLGPD